MPSISVFAIGSYKKCVLAVLPVSYTTFYPSRHTNMAPTQWIFFKTLYWEYFVYVQYV